MFEKKCRCPSTLYSNFGSVFRARKAPYGCSDTFSGLSLENVLSIFSIFALFEPYVGRRLETFPSYSHMYLLIHSNHSKKKRYTIHSLHHSGYQVFLASSLFNVGKRFIFLKIDGTNIFIQAT